MHRAGDTERGREPMGEVRNGKSGILCESICYESIGQRAGGGRCKLPPSSTLPVLREAFLSCLTTGRRQMVEGPSWAAEWRNTRIHKKHTSCRMPTTPHTVQCLQRVGVGLVREGQATVPDKTVQTNYQNRNLCSRACRGRTSRLLPAHKPLLPLLGCRWKTSSGSTLRSSRSATG